MPKSIVTLSGWGQKFNSLEVIFNTPSFKDSKITSLDYSSFNNVETFFSSIKISDQTPDILIGWSLGGQLAIRLIAQKIITPKVLVLIAPPFQMIKDARIQAGMSKTTFDEFYTNFAKAPNKTLKQFSILTAMNDKNASEIAKTLDISDKNTDNFKFWLEELARFSFFDSNLDNMPQTLFLQGAGDMIVHVSQADYFQQRIKNFKLELFKNCGHAPHLNDVDRVRKAILSL